MSKCPNKAHPLYQAYEKAIGENLTYQLFYENDFNLPDYKEHIVYPALVDNLSETDVIKTITNIYFSGEEVNTLGAARKYIPVTNKNIDFIRLNEITPERFTFREQVAADHFVSEITERNDVKFLQERFPDAPVEFYEGVVNVGSQVAHGYMKNAAFHIWTNSEVGTGYHEAFHGLTQMYFNNAQRSSLYDFAAEKHNMDRTNELALEEKLAEDFREYMILQENMTLPEQIKQFFKSLYYYIRAMVTDSVTMDQAYTMLESGRIPPRMKRNLDRFDPQNTLYSLRPSYATNYEKMYSEDLQRDVLLGIFDIFERVKEANVISGQNKLEPALLDDVQNYFFENMYSRSDGSPIQKDAKAIGLKLEQAKQESNEAYIDALNEFGIRYQMIGETPLPIPSNDALKYLGSDLTVGKIHDIHMYYTDVALNWETQTSDNTGNFTMPGWKDIFTDFLPEFGYVYSEQADVFIGTEDVQERIHNRSSLEESQRDKLSQRIKILLSTIPDGTGTTVLGVPRRINPTKAYTDILQAIHNESDYKMMINKLEDASVYKPYLNHVIDKIEDSDNNVKSQFFSNFRQSYTDFMTMKMIGNAMQIFSSNRNNLEVKIIDSWQAEAFRSQELAGNNIYNIDHEGEITLNKSQAEKVITPLKELQKAVNANRDPNAQDIEHLSKLLNALSIGQDVPMTEYLTKYFGSEIKIDNRIFTPKQYFSNVFNGLKNIVSEFADIDIKKRQIDSVTFKDEPNNFYEAGQHKDTLNLIADVIKNNLTNMVESFLDANKKSIYPFNMPTQLSDVVQQIKEGVYFEEHLKDSAYNPTGETTHQSPLIRLLQSTQVRDNFEFMKFDAYQVKKDEGLTYREQGEKLANLVRIQGFINSGDPNYARFFLPTQSDRDYLGSLLLPRMQSWKKFGLNDIASTKDVIRNEIIAQVAEYQEAKISVDTMSQDELIENYHYKEDTEGNVFRLTGLLEGFDWKKIDNKPIYNIDILTLIEHEQFDTIVSEYLSEFTDVVNEIANETKNYLFEHQVVSNVDGQMLDWNDKPVDTLARAKHDLGKHAKKYKTVDDLAQDYVLNSMVMKNEITKVFYQSRDYYKNLDDFYKRASLLTTPGNKPVLKNDVNPEWGLDHHIPEIIIKDDLNVNDDNQLYDFLRNTTWGKKIAKEYKAGESNKTDAQGYMSIDAYRQWEQGFGRWESHHEQAYQNYKDTSESNPYAGQFRDNNGRHPIIMPIKPSVMGAMPMQIGENQKLVPVSIKNSYTVLLKEFTQEEGTPLSQLDNLRKRMEAEGEYEGMQPIHWANTESTHKMFKNQIVDVRNTSDLSDVGIHYIPAELVRVPQIKPDKIDDTILISSQPLRLLTTVLGQITQDYQLRDQQISRNEWLDLYHGVVSQMVNNSIQDLRSTLKYNPEKTATLQQQKEMLVSLRDFIKEQSKESNRALSDNQIKAFDIEEFGNQARYKIPFAFPAFARKNEQMLFSLFKNNLINQRIHGKQVVQVGELGEITKDGPLKFITPTGEKVSEGVIGNIAKAEVAISADVARMAGIDVDAIRKGTLKLEDISEEARTILAHRIPTSGKNLMIPFVIKRILPENYKAAFVVPGRITTQMGSDFDIDTLFAYVPHNGVRDNKLQRKKYNTKDLSKNNREQLENLYFDLMESVLTHPDHFQDIITPLEGDLLANLAAEQKQKLDAEKTIKDTNPNSPFVDVDYQIRNRDGSSGIGIYSNALMGITTLQHMGLTITDKKAIKIAVSDYDNIQSLNRLIPKNEKGEFVDLEGNYIEHNITAHQVTSIDNAKDPIMHYLNDNVATIPVTLFMLSSGMDLARTTQFRTHPVIRELVRKYEAQQAKPYQLAEIASEIADIDSIETEDIVLDYVNNFEQNSDAEILAAFVQFHKSGQDFIRLSNIVTPNRISDMSSNAALAEYHDDIRYLNNRNFDTFVIPDGDKLGFLDSQFPMNEAYRDAIREAEEFSNNFFPYHTNIVKQLKAELTDNLIGKDKLSSDIHKKYHDFMFTYMLSLSKDDNVYSNFNVEHAKDLLLNEKHNPSFVERILQKKKENPYFANNSFIQAISNNRHNVRNEVQTFEFNTPIHYDKNESNVFSEALLDLYRNDNYRDIVRDLAWYSLYTTGFAPSPNSFVNLIPIEVWQDLNMPSDFYSRLQDLKDDQDAFDYAEMNYEFIRHNVQTKGFLHSLQLEKNEHERNILEFTYQQAKEKGAIYEKRPRPFVRAYNRDTEKFDLWVYQGRMKKGDKDYLKYHKSAQKGHSYLLTEPRMEDSNYQHLAETSILQSNRTDGKNHLSMLSPEGVQTEIIESETLDQRTSPMYNFKSKELRLKETFENIGVSVVVEHVPDLEEHGTIRTKKKALEDQRKVLERLESLPEENRSYTHNMKIKEAREKLSRIENVAEDVYIELRDLDNVETQVHEFGHLYIELLGRNSDIVKQGIDQLRGTNLWNDIMDLYSDYDIETREVEVLATAIGQEGARFMSQPWWKAWWNRMLNKLKDVLGIERNIAQQLAQEMLENDLRPVDTSQFIFDRTLRHRDAVKYERSKKVLQDLITSLDKQITSIQELSNDPKKSTQSRRNLRSRLEKLLDERKGIEDNLKGVKLFVENSYNEMRKIQQTMEELKYGKPSNFMKAAGEMIQVMEDYKVLDLIKDDVGDMLSDQDAETMKLLRYAIEFRDKNKNDITDMVIPKMAQELIDKADPVIEKEINNMLEKIDEGYIPNMKQVKRTRRFNELKNELENNEITQEEYDLRVKEIAKDQLKSRIPTSQNMETYLRKAVDGNRYYLWMIDPVIYTNDQSVQLFTLFVKDRMAEARRDTLEWRDRLDNLHKRFTQKTGRQGWNNEQIYEFMLEDVTYSTFDNGKHDTVNRKSFVQPYDMDRFNKKKNEVFDKLNKKYIPDDIDFHEWKEANSEQYREYKKEAYNLFYKNHMSPVDNWESIRDGKWNELQQATQKVKDLDQQLEQSDDPKLQIERESVENNRRELLVWFEDNFSDFSDLSVAPPQYPKGELSRPATGEGVKADYTNAKYQQIQNDPVLKEFYDEFMDIYRELQDIYGTFNFDKNQWDTYSYYTPSVRKNMKDRLIENGIKDSAEEYARTFRVLDTDDVYGQFVDERKKVPIYYANAVESIDISNDVPSSLMLFAKQAEEYKQLTDMLGHVHVMRNILENREIPKQDNFGNDLLDLIPGMRGWTRKVNDSVPANQTRQYRQWADWVDTIFYGITSEKAYLGNTNIELNKAMNKVNSYAAFNVFPFNFLQGVANILIGNSYIVQEAISGEIFTKGDYTKAQQKYLSASLGLLNDMGRTTPVSKLGQLIDLFDVQEGMTMRDIASNVFNTRVKNMTTAEQAFFLQRSGELQMAITPFLAIMNNIKVTDTAGNEISLYDAYEIKKDGKVGLKQKINLSKAEQNKITNRVNALNRSMQGVYDQFNASWLKKRWYGKPALLFRSWLLPTFRRFWGYSGGDFRLDHEMGSVREGIYQTAFRFLHELVKGNHKFTMQAYKQMSDVEQRNVKKFVTHMATIALTMGSIMALRAIEGEDEELHPSHYYALYWSHRLRSELMIFLMPHSEGMKLLRSPAASMMVLEKSTRFMWYLGAAPKQYIVDGDIERYQRRVGQFEAGTPKLYKAFRDMVPGINAFDNSMSPEEAYKWYTRMF